MRMSTLLPATLTCLLTLALVSASAQEATPKKSKSEEKQARREKINQIRKAEEEGAIVYNKEWVMGGRLYSDGWGAYYQRAKMKTNYKSNWFLAEVGIRKANNEFKLGNEDIALGFALSRPYIYGKQNVFLQTKFGVGQQFLIGGKGTKNGVAVSALYGGGLALSFLKPYYIEKFDARKNEVLTIKWQDNNSYTDTLFMDDRVMGASAGFFKGFSELKFRPGVFAKAGLRFDYGRYNELISAIECGVNAEFYAQKMPIMVDNTAKRFFANLYIAVEFGRRK